MSNTIKLLPAAILLLSSSASAMNLNEALSSTYETNKVLKSTRQNFLAAIEDFPTALSRFLPDVSANITETSTKSKNYNQPGAKSIESGPDGTRTIGITQNIFSGGSHAFGLKAAQASFWVHRTNLYNKEQEILTKATESYLNVAESKAKYEIALDSLAFYERNLHQAEEKLKVGESTVTEVSLARSNVSSALASKSKHYAELLAAKASFKSLTDLEATDDMNFPEVPSNLPQTLGEFEGRVLKTNLDLVSARYKLKQSKDTSNAAKGNLLPSANLSVKAQKNYFKGETISRFSDREKQLAVATSVSVDIPIYSKGGMVYSEIRRKNKIARTAVYALDQVERQIKSEIIGIWETYQAAKDSLDFVEKYVEYQKLALDGVKQEYEVGSKTMIDVLKTQEDYNKAKVQSVETRKQYILFSYKIKSLMGAMLGHQLKLNVKYFNPEKEFRNIKYKIIGF